MQFHGFAMDLKADSTHYNYLVMDDDLFTSALVAGMLRKMGATNVAVAENGSVALGHIEAGGKMPDIIISDLNMPQLDGVAFLRHLAEKQFAGGIVLISGTDKRILKAVVTLAEEHRLNVLGALAKPFTSPMLQNALARFNGAKEKSARLPLSPSLVSPEALRMAIEQNQLVPFFQPKVAVKTGSIIGVEALARWNHPERGLIPPNMFIPVAEKNGLIDLLTKDIFRKALQQVAVWHKNGLPLSFAVNFSVLSLSDIDLPDLLEAELRKARLDPPYLTLEVTESCLLERFAASLETLLRLRLKGINLSIDDFGTGHSSLEELHMVPFSELKIDRVFVDGACRDEELRVILQSAVSFGKKLDLSVVAEGVETQGDWDNCANLGCDVIQGYFVGRPMPGDVFLEWHGKRKAH